MNKLLLLPLLILFTGCTCMWTDELFFVDVLNNRDIADLGVIVEPNYIQVGATKYIKDPEQAEYIGGAGLFKIGDE